jgi:DNA-binding transcriptional regulator YdaS (Cro superfamily)
MLDVIERATETIKLSKLAQGLGVKHQSFYSWKQVPAERVLAFERLTGIHRSELRPDLYPPRRKAVGGAR